MAPNDPKRTTTPMSDLINMATQNKSQMEPINYHVISLSRVTQIINQHQTTKYKYFHICS